MTDKIIIWIRKSITVLVFIILCVASIQIIKKLSFRSQQTLALLMLLYLSLMFLAHGVSFLSYIIKKDGSYLKILTGLFSFVILILCLFPISQDQSLATKWSIVIAVSCNSILISRCSLFEFFKESAILKIYSFIFALGSGIFTFFITSMILRNCDPSYFGVAVIGYSIFIFLICTIINLIAISEIKTKGRE
jgi:hypothetical protein